MKRFGVILVSFVLLGGLGYFGWQKLSSKPAPTNNNSQQTNDPSEGGKYLVIKEWGVRFELTESLKEDIQYYLSGETIVFGSMKYGALEPLCAANKDSSIGIGPGLFRKATNDSYNESPTRPKLKQLENYIYYVSARSVSCNQNNTLTTEQTSKISAMSEQILSSLNTLEVINTE